MHLYSRSKWDIEVNIMKPEYRVGNKAREKFEKTMAALFQVIALAGQGGILFVRIL